MNEIKQQENCCTQDTNALCDIWSPSFRGLFYSHVCQGRYHITDTVNTHNDIHPNLSLDSPGLQNESTEDLYICMATQSFKGTLDNKKQQVDKVAGNGKNIFVCISGMVGL